MHGGLRKRIHNRVWMVVFLEFLGSILALYLGRYWEADLEKYLEEIIIFDK